MAQSLGCCFGVCGLLYHSSGDSSGSWGLSAVQTVRGLVSTLFIAIYLFANLNKLLLLFANVNTEYFMHVVLSVGLALTDFAYKTPSSPSGCLSIM